MQSYEASFPQCYLALLNIEVIWILLLFFILNNKNNKVTYLGFLFLDLNANILVVDFYKLFDVLG
jgi:hypothetical protein